MAVVAMKRFYCLAHQSLKSRLLDALHQFGSVQIEDLKERATETDVEPLLAEPVIETRDLHLAFSRVQFILDFFKEHEPKKDFLAGIVKEKVRTTYEQFNSIERQVKLDEIYEKCEDLDSELTNLAARRHNLEDLKMSLLPWNSLDVRLSELKDTETTAVAVGSLPRENLDHLELTLEEDYPETNLDVVSIERGEANISLIFHRQFEDEIQTLLSRLAFRSVQFLDLKETPADEIKRIGEILPLLEKERETKLSQIQDFLYLRRDLRILYDYLDNRIKKLEMEEKFAQTNEAFMIEGWMPLEMEEELRAVIEKTGKEVEVTFLEPTEEEKPPIVLRNNPVIQPFETLTRLFGMPDYNELDPTPWLAPFFFIFFGFCMGDVGYGFLLALIAFWLAKNLQVSSNAKKGLLLFAYGGISSVIIGVLTGSYFGLDPKYLPAFLKKMVVLWPLESLETFILLTIALGVVQVSLGIVLNGINKIRNSQALDAFFDQATVLFFLWSAVAVVAAGMANMMVKPAPAWAINMMTPSLWALSITTLAIVFLKERYLSNLFKLFSDLAISFRQKERSSLVPNLIASVFSTSMAISVCGWVLSFLGWEEARSGFGIFALLSFVAMLATRPGRRLIIDFLSGAYALYGMSNYIGNFLSYVRLLALGLSTGLIAWSFNLLVEIGIGLSGISGYLYSVKGLFVLLLLLLLILAVISLHLLINLGIGLIGSFVHPTRLSFVEFFGQFYSGSGRKFEPFGVRTKYLLLEE